jgi:peptide chain release factor 1
VFERLGGLTAEYAEIERELADPRVHADQERARALGKRYAELSPVVHAYQEWQRTAADETTARELAAEDPSFAAEAEELGRHKAELEQRLTELLAPREDTERTVVREE